MASVIMSLLPFSGAGGVMISPEFFTVLMAALAAIGVGDEWSGDLAVDEHGVGSLAVGDTGRVPLEPRPSGGSAFR
jgi:hypothetical protein